MTPETPLDYALLSARQEEQKSDAYYTLFLNTDVFVPTADLPTRLGTRVTEESEVFNFIVMEQDGQLYMPVFDTVERLRAWSGREMGVVRLSAATLIEAMDSDIQIALNLKTDFFKEFSANELHWLRRSLAASVPKETILEEDTLVIVGVPSEVPAGLLDALRLYLSRRPGVLSAHLGLVNWPDSEGPPHFVLLLEMDPHSSDTFAFVASNIGPALRGALRESEYLDIVERKEGDDWSAITEQSLPFYRRFPKDS